MKILLAALVLLFMQTFLFGQTNNDWELTFSDEFEGTGAPDSKKWERQEYNRRNNNNGPDGYWSRQDSYLNGNGQLVIRVRTIGNQNGDADPYDFSVGALRSKGKFEQLYGKFEISCQLPTQSGWWVAFWMMQGNVGQVGNGGVDGSEVDIMEGFGWTDKINLAIHYDGYGDDHKSKGFNKIYPGIREGFHTYALEWFPEKYLFYIDGVQVWETTGGGVCNQPGYLKVTGEISTEDWAVNEWWANTPDTTFYPDSFLVDYVRVYQFPDSATGAIQMESPVLKVYPNPAGEVITVSAGASSFEQAASEILVLNAAGKVVKELKNVYLPVDLALQDFEKGIYGLMIHTNGKHQHHRFIKSH
ncbi:MAG: family 16 glycosylhydrolase [Prolixibacteraceae bacterium]|nr:family 16 glycosylhydrolase [Prolixibacteraceae bacterium]